MNIPAKCQPPRPDTSIPRHRAPAGACDSHFHIIGPEERYPLTMPRSYTPVGASVVEYRRMADALGLKRGVIVTPSPYGLDNSVTLDALAELGAGFRAVVVTNDRTSVETLRDWDRLGVRGVRFNLVTKGGPKAETLRTVAERIAGLGWHLQLYVHGAQLPDLAPMLTALPLPVVIDHMGQIPVASGLNDPGLVALRRMLETGRCWTKLCGYRSSSAGYPFHDVTDLARSLVETAPEHCIWGTDWPHTDMQGTQPDDGELLDLLREWAGSDRAFHAILTENPARLYGFDQ